MDEEHRAVIRQWVTALRRAAKEYKDLVYNANTMLKEAWTYQELASMPIRDLLDEVHYITPKLKEIARQRESERLKAELAGKKQPNNGRRNRKGLGV